MATKLSITSVQVLCFISCSAAIAFVKAPFVIALLPVFIDFITFMGIVLENQMGIEGKASKSYTT